MNRRRRLLPLFSILGQLIDEHVGLIRSVVEIPREAGAPEFFHFYADACNTRVFCAQQNFGKTGGASTDRGIAMAKAVGEAIERYCSAIFDPQDFALTSYDDAPFLCVAPDRFALYSVEQYQQAEFPYVPFLNSTPVRWTPAVDAMTGKTFHVPAAMVYVPYAYTDQDGEPPITQRISTGLACHSTPAEAAETAICEVIERDAITIAWQAMLGMPQIRINSLSESNRDLVARFERTGSSVTLLNLTLDHAIPTILSVFQGSTSDSPALVCAAASHLDPEHAVRKSLEELAHTRRMAQQLKSSSPPFLPSLHYENVSTQDDHVHLYCNDTNTPLARFLLGSPKQVDFAEIENLATGHPQTNLGMLIEKIRAINHQVLLKTITTPDVVELGLSVVRAIIPGFHPLFLGHRVRALGGSRLWEVPQRLGYGGVYREQGANPAPHPFP